MIRNKSLLQYAFMRLTRELDSRFESLLLTGRIPSWQSEIGHEATTVPAGLALAPGDVLCSLHRDLGAILAVYLDPARAFPGFGFGEPDRRRPDPVEILERLVAQLLGRANGFSAGIDKAFQYAYLEPEEGIRHLGMIGHLGAMIPVAAGCAFALKHEGSDRVVLNFIGDGGTSTGDFHEGLNIAAVWKLPLVLVIENNRYAYATPARLQYAAAQLSDRGRGYGMAGITVDGNQPEVVARAVEDAIARARAGDGPTLIEAMLGRMRGQSEGDDSLRVVPPRELAAYRASDPLKSLEAKLRNEGVLDPETRKSIGARAGFLVEAAVDSALRSAQPEPATAWRGVFSPARSAGAPAIDSTRSTLPAEPVSYLRAITMALQEEMERNDKVLLMGQDIGAFEGAFKATRGLHNRWPRRVLDTPVAESGTVGAAVGAGLLGYRVVVEMQSADYVTCAFNQLVNLAAKLYYRWRLPCPIVVRLPSGGGSGGGAFQSQSPEAWFTHVAGLKVVYPSNPADVHGLLKASIRDPNPVIFCEHKSLYRAVEAPLPVGDNVIPLGLARVSRPGRHVSLITYGLGVSLCLDAAERLAAEGIEAEVVDLRTLVPLDIETLEASIRRTSRAVVVHEAQRTGGFGAEIGARIAEDCFSWLDAPLKRIAYPDRPVPFAEELETALAPGADQVVQAARETFAF